MSCCSNFPSLKSYFLDASVMLKLFIDENGSKIIRDIFNDLDKFFSTTNFCYFETLSVLKRKWLKKEMSYEHYLSHCRLLFAYINEGKIEIIEYPMKNLIDFGKIERLSTDYDIDISDALQLVSIKETYLNTFVEESETALITADKQLAIAAKKENIKCRLIQ